VTPSVAVPGDTNLSDATAYRKIKLNFNNFNFNNFNFNFNNFNFK